MKALIQRVKSANVVVSGKKVGEIGNGLLVLLGISNSDKENDVSFFVDKIAKLRIFEDEEQKMNLSLVETKGEVLVVSQFTLYADCKGQRRPSFVKAAGRELALSLYKKFVQEFKGLGVKTEEGEFGAMMDVSLVNSGPVTIMLDSEELM